MTQSREFTLTANLMRVLTSKGFLLVCIKCEIPFKDGDQVVSRSDRNNTKRYHKACWESIQNTFYQPKYLRLLHEDYML